MGERPEHAPNGSVRTQAVGSPKILLPRPSSGSLLEPLYRFQDRIVSPASALAALAEPVERCLSIGRIANVELARPPRVRFPSAFLAAAVAPLDAHVGENSSESRVVRIQGG